MLLVDGATGLSSVELPTACSTADEDWLVVETVALLPDVSAATLLLLLAFMVTVAAASTAAGVTGLKGSTTASAGKSVPPGAVAGVAGCCSPR